MQYVLIVLCITSIQKKRGTRIRIILRIRMKKLQSTAARSFRPSFCTERQVWYKGMLWQKYSKIFAQLFRLRIFKYEDWCTSVLTTSSEPPFLLQRKNRSWISQIKLLQGLTLCKGPALSSGYTFIMFCLCWVKFGLIISLCKLTLLIIAYTLITVITVCSAMTATKVFHLFHVEIWQLCF